MEAVINDYISRELVQDASLLPLENTTQLLETGILDSLSLLRLVIFVQEQFGIVVDDLEGTLKTLTTLNLACTQVTDAGLKELATLKNLTTLELALTKVTDAGLKELQLALPNCKIEK